MMKVVLIKSINYFLNTLPPVENLLLGCTTPLEFITGHLLGPLSAQLEFGKYVELHQGKTNNSMAPRTFRCLAMEPFGNQQGGYYFYKLENGEKVTGFDWTCLSIGLAAAVV